MYLLWHPAFGVSHSQTDRPWSRLVPRCHTLILPPPWTSPLPYPTWRHRPARAPSHVRGRDQRPVMQPRVLTADTKLACCWHDLGGGGGGNSTATLSGGSAGKDFGRSAGLRFVRGRLKRSSTLARGWLGCVSLVARRWFNGVSRVIRCLTSDSACARRWLTSDSTVSRRWLEDCLIVSRGRLASVSRGWLDGW